MVENDYTYQTVLRRFLYVNFSQANGVPRDDENERELRDLVPKRDEAYVDSTFYPEKLSIDHPSRFFPKTTSSVYTRAHVQWIYYEAYVYPYGEYVGTHVHVLNRRRSVSLHDRNILTRASRSRRSVCSI